MKKYLVDGQEVEVVQQLKDGRWLVYRYYTGYTPVSEDDYYEDKILSDYPDLVSDVFDTPPVPKIAERIRNQLHRLETIEDDINEAIKKRDTLESEYHQAQRTHKERMAKYEKYSDALQNLDDLLEERITHIVVKKRWEDYGRVRTYDKAEFIDRYGKPKKYLVLGKEANKPLKWYLSEYDDSLDSCDSVQVWPCTSEVQARAIVQGQIDEVKTPSRQLIDYAKKYGYTIKDGWEDQVKADEKSKRLKSFEKAKKELETAQKRLEELEGGK